MSICRARQTLSVAIFAALALACSAPAGHAATAGAIDPSFRSDPYPLGVVRSAGLKPDGRIAIGGVFQTFSGGTPMNYAAVLGSNGALDTSFADPLINADVYAVAVQADGKILVAGDFNQVGSTPRSRVARLNANGSLDGSFNPPTLDGNVNAVALQPDGKVMIGGTFTSRVARLNANGSLDASFAPPGLNDIVRSVVLQPDGKAIIGGDFTTATTGGAPQPRERVARLNADGSLDTGFGNPGIICRGGGTPGTGQECLNVFAYVDSIAVQADGKLVVAGVFDSVQGNTDRRGIARLNADGSLDTGFVPPGINMAGSVFHQATLQLDGKLIVAGAFTRTAAPATINGALRLNSDGTVDSDFAAVPIGNPPVPPFVGGPAEVFAAPLQDDGKLVLAGYFQINSGGTAHLGLARAYATVPQAAPASVSATAGNAQASVSWSPLTGEISGYTVTASPGGASCTTTTSGCTITGLANGTSYTFGVRATNSFGPGPARQSNAVTPGSGDGGATVSVSSVKSKVTSKGAYITSRVRVSGAGRISQRATTGSSRRLKTWCRASKATTRAGTQTLKCNLASKGRKALKKSSLKLTLRTGFTPTGGSAIFANKALTIKRKR